MEIGTQPAAEIAGDTQELPFVSVIVPVRNEEGFISVCLSAIAAQDYPRDRFEVILVDGMSTDNTAGEVRDAQRIFGIPDVLAANEQRTSATGLNQGISLAKGEVIIRVDGHTRIDPTFISASVRALKTSGADAVGGPIRTRGAGDKGRAIAAAMTSRFGIGDAAFRYSDEEQWTDSVAFGAYKRGVFERVGTFADITGGEDDEFNYRLRSAGGRILLTPWIGSIYYCRDTFGGLMRQYWAYGMAKAEVLRRHPGRLRWRHLVPSSLLLTLVVGTALSIASRRLSWILGLAAGSYALTNLLASGLLALRIGRAGRFLPLVFATIHFAAGAGMIAGFLGSLPSRGKRNRA